MAIPAGMSCESPGSSVSGASRHARRSSPAAPGEPYEGMRSRILASRIFTSSLRTSALRSRHQRSDVRDELAREIDLRPAPERMLATVVEEGERVVVRAERLVREVGSEQRNAFACALVLRVRAQVLALRGKAAPERPVLAARH